VKKMEFKAKLKGGRIVVPPFVKNELSLKNEDTLQVSVEKEE
jgi:hypothetical protein